MKGSIDARMRIGVTQIQRIKGVKQYVFAGSFSFSPDGSKKQLRMSTIHVYNVCFGLKFGTSLLKSGL